MADNATSGQQTIGEGPVAQGVGVRSDFERRRSRSFSRRGFTRQRLGISFVPRLQRLQIAFQVVEEAHSF